MKKFATQLAATTIVMAALAATSAAQAGLPHNGPELTGSRLLISISAGSDEAALIPGGQGSGCVPGTGCPTNGPELTGVQLHFPGGGLRLEDIRTLDLREAARQ